MAPSLPSVAFSEGRIIRAERSRSHGLDREQSFPADPTWPEPALPEPWPTRFALDTGRRAHL